MPGPSPKIGGLSRTDSPNEKRVSHSGLTGQATTPQRPYEPTGDYPSQPAWGGRARMTRTVSGPGGKPTEAGDPAPYQEGPSKRNKPEVPGPDGVKMR